MITFHLIVFILISINVPSVSSSTISTYKIKQDIYRIRQILKPFRHLYNSPNVYRKYNNMLQILWTSS